MDHLTSRFRRNTKRESPTSPQDPPSPDRKPVRPSLAIATSPSPTTPPGSSQGSHTLLPSPLRGLNQLRAAHKRGRSPTSPQLTVPNIMNFLPANGAAAGGAPANKDTRFLSDIKQPQMPSFLQLSEANVKHKFQELIWLERMRIQQGAQNPSPGFRFARIVSSETKDLDRYTNIQPWANNRVHLAVPEGKFDYINASPIISASPLRPTTQPVFKYIAMQGPKFNTVEHTWRMIAQLQSPVVIVMLTDTHDGHMEKCYPYFPFDPHDDTMDLGQSDEFEDGFLARIECISLEERQDGAIQMRKLNLHVKGHGDTVVWHLLYRRWPDFGVPKIDDHDSFFELMKLSRELNSTTDNPRIVHCSAGVGRTGTFIALETLLREVDDGAMDYPDQEVNDNTDDLVFWTVNHLREQRRTMVQAESQYDFIYRVLRRRWLEKHGFLDDADGERASKRKHNASLRKTTFGQVRKARQVQQPSQPVDNDSSDDSMPGGVSLRQVGN